MEWTRFGVHGVAGHVAGTGERLAVVLHGGPGLTDYTAGLAEEVSSAGASMRVVRYQQRGQPPSTLDGPLTVAQLVEDFVQVLHHVGGSPALVVGHSWGGFLAMHMALAAPEHVSGLLLVDTLGALGDGGTSTMGTVILSRIGADARAKLERLDELSEEEQSARRLPLMWPGYFADPASAPPAPDIRYAADVGAALMGDALDLLRQGVLERGLPLLDKPSVHLIGRYSPLELSARVQTAALMRGAIVQVLDTGHFPWLEQPGSVTAATRRLLPTLV